MPSEKFTQRSVDPADIVSAAQTISRGSCCIWDLVNDRWVPAASYLEWSKRGLAEGGEYGLSNAVTYAKRAVCRTIDGLIVQNHLCPATRQKYPKKMETLARIGIEVHSIVHDFVINPRNTLEHDYATPDDREARRCVEVADLLVRATREETALASVVGVGLQISYRSESHERDGIVEETIEFSEFRSGPMLFVDVFERPFSAKIIHPEDREICAAELDAFAVDESVELAKILRKERDKDNFSTPSKKWFAEFKSQHGL